MKKMLLFTFCVIMTCQLHSQWSIITGPGNTSITAMTKQGNALIVGTDLQGIHRSTDQGNTWRTINGNLSNFSVQSILAQPSYILAGITSGSDKGLYQTTDNGTSWKKYASPFANSAVTCILKVDTVILVGSTSIYRSTNDAVSFQSSASGIPAGSKIVGFAVSGNIIIAAADVGLYRSTDLGSSWTEVRKNTLYTEISYSITAANGNFYAANQNGGVNAGKDSVYKSTDNGVSWISIKNNLPQYLYGQYLMAYGDTIFYGMQSEAMYRSLNGAQSWQIDSVGMDNRRTQCGMIDGSVIYSGGNYYVSSGQVGTGGLYVSTNNGNSWSRKFQPINSPMVNGFFKLGQKIFAHMTGTKVFGVFVSTNNGSTWTKSSVGLVANGAPGALKRPVIKKGIIFGAGATVPSDLAYGVVMSVDSGATWSAANTGLSATGTVNSFFVDADTLYACMKEGLFRTTNNGTSWSLWGTGLPASNIKGMAVLNDTMYATVGTAKVYRSLNRGRTWYGATTNQALYYPEQLFVHEGKMYTISGSGESKLMVCSDSGKTWNELNAAFGTSVQSLSFASSSIFARVNSKGIYQSTDAGTTWKQVNTGMLAATPLLSAMAVIGDSLYASYNDGGILRRGLPEFGITTVQRKEQPVSPNGFTLTQNYPNPFNPSTKIDFTLVQNGFVSLTVYDAVGREVASPVQEHLNAGTYSAEFNGNGLASGVYFYRLISGTQVSMKKMILLK